jgi:hypothetical protein
LGLTWKKMPIIIKINHNRVNQGRRLKEEDHAQTPSVDEETIKKVRKVAIDPGVGV